MNKKKVISKRKVTNKKKPVIRNNVVKKKRAISKRKKVSRNIERTLSIIKPDAVKNDYIGGIFRRFERNGLRIVAARMMQLTDNQAREFYSVHEGKDFFEPLVHFMTSGPIMVQVLEGENAISRHRMLMGATNPDEAAPGTIRAEFAEATSRNAVHGSDGHDTAETEINFFFEPEEIVPRSG